MDYVKANVEHWQGRRDREVRLARRQWSSEEPTWGNFGVPEAVARMLPTDLDGARTVELGCGTGYVSAWLARRGALPVAIDPTPGQLEIARQFQDEHEVWFPLVRAAGEQVPLRDRSFDLVISEYGAAIWADPFRWIPEAARLLRPGGELVFMGNATLLMLCLPDEEDAPASDRLLRPQFGIHRFEWADNSTVTFHLSHGDWIKLLRGNGFEIEALVELRPQSDTAEDSAYITTAWARRWPCEEGWRARKRDDPLGAR